MFLQNLGYRWGILDDVDPHGAIFRAAGQNLETALDRKVKDGLGEKLFDPQAYLLDYTLDSEDYPTVLAKLATYPWFGMTVPKYEPGEKTRTAWFNDVKGEIGSIWAARVEPLDRWEAVVGECIQFQEKFDCTKVIVPSRLLVDPEDNLDQYFSRLDEAIAVAQELTKRPLLAAVPIDQNTIAYREPHENELMDALADGLTARDGLAGFYITLSAETAAATRVLNPRVAGSLVRLCSLLGGSGDCHIVVNYVESLGLACLGAGATAYAAGYSQKDRWLHISDYRDRSGGVVYPKFHSLNLVLDLNTSTDLERLRNARLLRYFEGDRTESSASLLDALDQGVIIDELSLPAWAQRRGNALEAQKHFVQLHTIFASRTWTIEKVLEWLQDAEAKWNYLYTRFEDEPLEVADGRHLAPWRRAVEAIA